LLRTLRPVFSKQKESLMGNHFDRHSDSHAGELSEQRAGLSPEVSDHSAVPGIGF
jgi:hypothetical protein